MKRNLELIRKLMLFFDDKSDFRPVEVPQIPDCDEREIRYHLVLLYDAGFLRCEPSVSTTSDRVISVLPFDLTWQGPNFLTQSGTLMFGTRLDRTWKTRDLLRHLLVL